jgi:hypothetical protein
MHLARFPLAALDAFAVAASLAELYKNAVK